MKTKLLFTLAALLMVALNSFAQSWGLTGNSGTNTSTNFLGTIDKKGLVLRTNNIERLRITQAGNVGIGTTNPLQKLDVNGNININRDSGLYFGNERIIHVYNANFLAGSGAGGSITNGDLNTACGFGTLLGNTAGSANTAIGAFALSDNTTGYENTASGMQSLTSNTTGYENSAFGYFSLRSNTTGYLNTASGYFALRSNTTGTENTATGSVALYSNTMGSGNTAVGNQALYSNTEGVLNTASGSDVLYNNTVGFDNTASGNSALYLNTSGVYNTAFGVQALIANVTGNYNTAVGTNANVNADNLSNSTAVGNAALITANNQVRIGNSDITSIGGYKGWTKISDGRIKTNIKNNVPGLAFINKLNPITYNLNLDAADKIVQRSIIKTKDGKTIQPSEKELATRKAEEKVVYTGFIAQDVEKAAKELNYDFSGVDAAKNNKDLYGLRYAEFVVPLVKAVQELSAQNDELRKENNNQQKINEALQKQIDDLKKLMLANNQQVTISSSSAVASLEQNVPNPFNQSTSIHYNLPSKFTSAQIVITDNNGITIKQFNLPAGRQGISAAGKGTLSIEAGSLSSGTYNYSLLVDGKLTDSKKMVLTK